MAGFGESPADFEAWERALRGGAPAAPRTPPPVTAPPVAAAAAPAAAAASPGFMSAAMRALGPLGALILADRFSSRNDPRLPPSFVKGPEELYADAMKALPGLPAFLSTGESSLEAARRAQAERDLRTQTAAQSGETGGSPVIPEPRDRREDAFVRRGGFTPTPSAQISRSAAAPTPVASQDFMDMLARAAAMRGRERESYGTETAPPIPSAPKREYEPGMRG